LLLLQCSPQVPELQHELPGRAQLPSAQGLAAGDPSETANVESFFFNFELPQLQTGFSAELRIKISVCLPHSSQIYSNIGMSYSLSYT
jgi:hypothetical protein